MKLTTLVLVALVAYVTATEPVDPLATRSISSTVTNSIEDLRDQMPCGFPSMGIPPLAPLIIAHKEISIDRPSLKMNGTVNDFHLYGLNQFSIAEMKVNAITSKATFRFVFDSINVDTQYDLNVLLKKAGFTINVVGNGQARFAISNMEIWGTLKYSFGLISQKLKLKSFELRTHIGDVESNIDGILGQGLVNQKMNSILAEGVQIAINENEQFITQTIESIVVPAANEVLSKYSLSDIISSGGGGGGSEGGDKQPCVAPAA